MRSLPYKVLSPKYGQPPTLLCDNTEFNIQDLISKDIKRSKANVVCVQLDPMLYARSAMEFKKIIHKQNYEEELKDDPVQVEKNLKILSKIFDNTLHPLHGEFSGINMKIVEIMFNSIHQISNSQKFSNFFDPKTVEIIHKFHHGEITSEEENYLQQRIKSVQDILDFASTEYISQLNPSPYHGMEEIYKSTFGKLIDVCLIDYPEPLNRLYMDKYAKLDYHKCKGIYESIMISGEQLGRESEAIEYG